MERKSLNKMTIIVSTIILTVMIINIDKLSFDYEIVDEYRDTNQTGQFVFKFIEVNRFDTTMIKLLTNKIVRHSKELRRDENNTLKVLIEYLYFPEDVTTLPKDKIDFLMKSYPGLSDISKKINYIENGMIYMRFSRRIDGYSKLDTIFSSELFIPANAYKAKEIFTTNKQ